jgi:hypothetical protein
MATLNPKELDPVYQTVSHEEAVAIANLGAQVYVAMKDRLYETWASSMVGDEASKAEIWRQEGRQAMLESMKSKLVAAEKLQEQLTLIEVSREADHQRADQRLRYETELLKKEIADIQQQHCQSMESEVGRRLAGAVRVAEDRKDQEAASLRLRIAALTEETQNQAMLDASREKKIEAVETELSIQLDRFEEIKRNADKELAARLEEAKAQQMIILELQKSVEISDLRQKIAELNSKEELLVAKEESRKLLADKVQQLEAEIKEHSALIKKYEAESTKSSYALGKEGEALIFDIITEYVLPAFLYSSAKDMSGLSHVADIHLFLQSPVGKLMKILIDAKKYKDAVRGKEITKLHSDVDSDDEAMAGIMISTSSPIASVKQFQIEKTPKGKYILYLSVEGFDDELRGKAICWAIRVLSTLASYSDDTDVNIMTKIAEFFKELDLSLKEADGLLKACLKSYNLATVMKKNLGQRLENFRVEHLGGMVFDSKETGEKTRSTKQKTPVIESQEDVITHEEEEPALSPMQRYYKANREEILAKNKVAREKKKKDPTS